MNEAELQETLNARAAALRPQAAQREAEDTLEILVLRVGAERLGLPLDEAEAVVSDLTVTPVPNLGPPWSGVVHLRGRFIAVADLGLLVGGSSTDIRCVVVLASDDSCAFGLEHAPSAGRIREGELASTSRDGTTIARSVRGTAPDGTALLDSAALLAALAL